MIGALGEHLQNWWLQLFCVDSVDAESWYAKHKHPDERLDRHIQYEKYIIDEVLPFTQRMNANPYLIAAGASFGAYHAVNLAFRHPQLVNRVLGLSGVYDIKRVFQDSAHAVYFHDPSHYMVTQTDPVWLDAVRRLNIILAIGRADPNCQDNEHLSGTLWSRDIWHALRVWDGWAHDWPWWRQMIQLYIGGND